MSDTFFTPVSGFDLPRFAGVPTFMRLPHVPPSHPRFVDVEIGLVGAPWDSSNGNDSGKAHVYLSEVAYPNTYCTSKVNSSGCKPGIGFSGTAWLEELGCKATPTHLYLMEPVTIEEGLDPRVPTGGE